MPVRLPDSIEKQVLRCAQDDKRNGKHRICAPEGVLHPVITVICILLLGSFAVAQSITGTVTNGTTGKPAAGDEVTLLALSQGMQEIGSTKSDAQGSFPFRLRRIARRTWFG